MAQARALSTEQQDLASFLLHSDEIKEMHRIANNLFTKNIFNRFRLDVVEAIEKSSSFARVITLLESNYGHQYVSNASKTITFFTAYMTHESNFLYLAWELQKQAEKFATIRGYAKSFAWSGVPTIKGDELIMRIHLKEKPPFDPVKITHLIVDGVSCKILERAIETFSIGQQLSRYKAQLTISTTEEAIKNTLLADHTADIPLHRLKGEILATEETNKPKPTM